MCEYTYFKLGMLFSLLVECVGKFLISVPDNKSQSTFPRMVNV